MASCPAMADITNRFSGFASIGVVSNDNPDLVFRRDVTQFEGSYDRDIDWRSDSLLGLQWQTQWSYQLETTAQIVLRDRLENDLNNSLEWVFVRYRPLDGLDIRVGRMGTDIFMLSDYRQVGYALPWVRPPHDTYGLLSFYHFDGIDINKRFDINDGTLNIKAFYGRSDQKYPLDRQKTLNYRLIFEGAGTSINWERDEWKLRYSYANVEVQNNNPNPLVDALLAVSPYWPDAADLSQRFYTQSKHFKYHQLGMGYDNNIWWLQAEATQLNSDAIVISSTRHFYLSLGRRIDAFTFYAIKGFVHTRNDSAQVTAPYGFPSPLDQQLATLAAATELALNGSRCSQNS
ncbi:MAG: hypothetical protein EOO68_13040, partial [Moraxellaceae bacterium]